MSLVLPDRLSFTRRYSALTGARAVTILFLVVWIGLVILPLLVLFAYSFFDTKTFVTIYQPSLKTWTTLFESGRWEVAIRTVRIALTVTLIELACGFPFALWLAKGCRSKSVQAVALTLLTIPFFLDMSSRTIVWRAILGREGLINSLLMGLGITDQPMEWMLYSEFSVHFGMIAPYFPTMVLPIYLAMTFIDDDLIKASNDLGGSPLQTLLNVIIPLSLPGIIAGVVFTLGPALAAWVEPGMLGGGFVNLLSNSVESAYTALKYPVVAALSTFVILILAVLLGLLLLFSRRVADLAASFKVMRS